MSRYMTAPGVWRDDGPASASVRSRPFSVQADNVGQMRPTLTAGAAYEWHGPKQRALTVRSMCGEAIRGGTTCARTPGHRDYHASRAALDHEMLRRRTR
jgi:hypothetical protein